jgi:hypothetical protein
VLIVISPQVYRPLMLLIGCLGDLSKLSDERTVRAGV